MAAAAAEEENGPSAGEKEKKVPSSKEKRTETNAVPIIVESDGSKGSGAADHEINGNTEHLREKVKELLSTSKTFEVARKQYCHAEAQASTVYWESLKDLVKRNLLNIEKSALYVKSRLEAERSYAESLYNLQDKVEGNPIDNTQSSIPKGQKRRGSTSQRRSQYHDRKGDDNRDKATGIMSKPEKNATALEHMYWHDANTANLVMDMCNDVEEKALNEILEKMMVDITKTYSQIITRGDLCFKVLQAHEAASEAAFKKLKIAISTTLDQLDAVSREGSSSLVVQTTTSGHTSSKRNAAENDVWKADCQYKICASQQLVIHEDAQLELSKLFSGVKALESSRRASIRDSLTYFVRAYDSLLRDLPLLRDPVLLMLDRIVTDKEVLDQYVHAALGRSVRELKMEEGSTESLEPSQQTSSNITTVEVPFKDLSTKLENPLLGSLISKLALVERRKDGVMITRWIKCLLVATEQNYLYIYDVKRHFPTPELAFKHIIPVTPLKAAIESAEKSHRNGQIHVPNCEENMSLDLSHSYCEVPATEIGKGNMSQMTIVEVKKATGMKMMLRAFNRRHLILRGEKKDMQNLARFVTSIGTTGVRDAIAQGYAP